MRSSSYSVYHRLHCSTSYAVTVWLIHRCSILIWPGPHRTYFAILDCTILSCTVLFLIRSLTSISSFSSPICTKISGWLISEIFLYENNPTLYPYSCFPVFRTLFFPLLLHSLILPSLYFQSSSLIPSFPYMGPPPLLLSPDDWQSRVPLCYLMLEGRKDPSKVGLMYLCTFTLLKLSGERSFGVCLNQPYVLTLPVDVPPFSGMTYDSALYAAFIAYHAWTDLQYMTISCEMKINMFQMIWLLHKLSSYIGRFKENFTIKKAIRLFWFFFPPFKSHTLTYMEHTNTHKNPHTHIILVHSPKNTHTCTHA